MPSLTMPYVCFACRKSFKRRRRFGDEGHRAECPACHATAVALHPHFKAPRAADVRQWAKVQRLVEAGVYFCPLTDPLTGNPVKYPDAAREVDAWVRQWSHLLHPRGDPAVA